MSESMTTERLTYLREWLRQKLEDYGNDDLFLDDGDNRIIWVSNGDEVEIVVITLEPGKIEVAT
jgi:hypothetical protein